MPLHSFPQLKPSADTRHNIETVEGSERVAQALCVVSHTVDPKRVGFGGCDHENELRFDLVAASSCERNFPNVTDQENRMGDEKELSLFSAI